VEQVGDGLGVGLGREGVALGLQLLRSSSKFSMMPLCTTARPPEMCGWALRSEGTPWVAQRVWAMPMLADSWVASAWAASSATRPTARRR
jgi:hypothetical protein